MSNPNLFCHPDEVSDANGRKDLGQFVHAKPVPVPSRRVQRGMNLSLPPTAFALLFIRYRQPSEGPSVANLPPKSTPSGGMDARALAHAAALAPVAGKF